jgi:sugar fermentation stimulation protein A
MLKRFWKRSMNNAIVKSPLIHKSLIDFHDWFYVFIEKRINRFVVQVNFGDGKSRQVATNNPGRLSELMVAGRKAVCISNPQGKTAGKLIAIQDDFGWAFIDTFFQMRAFEMAVQKKCIPWLEGYTLLKRNPRLGESVLDYWFLDSGGETVLLELKSAVYRQGRFATYPDCPSTRGQRHIRELTKYAQSGGKGLILFIASLAEVDAFRPAEDGDPEVGRLLRLAVDTSPLEIRALSLLYDPESGLRMENHDLPVIIQ